MHIEWNDDGTVGGSHQALYDLVTRLDRGRFEPVALFHQNNPFCDRLTAAGVQVCDYGEAFRRERDFRRSSGPFRRVVDLVKGVQRRVRFLRENDIGLVHLNNSPDLGGMDWMPAARVRGIPVVSSVMSKGDGRSSVVRKIVYRGFHKVLPVSEVVADRWISMGVPEDRTRVVHHGVDIERLRSKVDRDRAAVRADLGVPPDRLYVLMAGNVRPWKGQHVVLEALATLKPEVRDRLFVVFAGAPSATDAEYVQRLETMIGDHALEGCVSMVGFRTDIANLLAAADIVVHASVEIEPGGIIVLEAMALGCTVVAAAEGGHTEVMQPGTGLTFDARRPRELAERLATLTEDRALREDLGRVAAMRISQFDVSRNVRETEAVYEELLAR